MSSGFPFGGGRGDGGGIPPTEPFFLYGGRGGGGGRRDPEIGGSGYTRGFELTWQHQQIGQQQQQHYSAAVGFPGDLPLVADPRSEAGRGGAGGGHSCQDCGNQAKKDCSHLRCRTCCKSRGFQCSTHVKSTWVPAAKRRERQQQLASAAAGGESSKRSRDIVVAATTATTYGGSQNHELFPAEVNAEAMFRCVRVSPVDEAEEEYAYQTTVSIAGHMFKGVLYDHGSAGPGDFPSSSSSRYQLLTHGEESSSPATAGAAPTANASTSDAANTAATAELLEPYPTPLSAFIAGTPFFPHQRYRPS